ncbi:MAG: GNAT family N-acetyltransferase [Candidatus Marinimicrobia bacterium]|nr:GNAT family N-acetyltransferase [Candidatus Neomarinimicrobiota bacterium]MBT4361775.1 GNAT family N-acetyltransferase [Candidatus Neomarinimicrobiota bacterium]MBT4714469.1 GNAT family N-acetyltransferase [Candidatus Neomarinimicrobiota bacterium]MBT4946170.1 GNAT family N-acetyltransferase [Candidatus Neomarinimicrobiota bacterium]MBT5268969.1 GNAT family N-acetyltransferase [Candidatus Neomarinimicrobiota bacterium]
MSDPKIELRELDKSNYRDILNLKVADNQTGFVASNAISLAQALFHSQAWYRGIYRGDTAVGFVMLDLDMEKPDYYLWRYMIDEKFQGHGYGYKALELVIEHVKSLPNSTEFLLSYVPKEGNPKGFYEKLGFLDTGEIEEGEVIMKLEFK